MHEDPHDEMQPTDFKNKPMPVEGGEGAAWALVVALVLFLVAVAYAAA